jgi:DNA helicase MCM9
LAIRKSFRCCLCSHTFTLDSSLSLFNSFEMPSHCPSSRCRSFSFEEVPGSEEWIDYREVKIYDAFTSAYRGRLPSSLWAILTSEHVGLCAPGDDVSVSGVLMKRWLPLLPHQPCEVQLSLYATSVQVFNSKLQRPFSELVDTASVADLALRQSMLSSFAPSIYGCAAIKLGILLCIIGGVREEISALHLRGHSHCLLLGEPGTGKSDILREACKVASRGIYTNAIGASKAGLTLSAVKEGSDWMLEAGALVLADSGLCALDDLAFLNKEDLSEIYECMENQTISVAKAGMVCTVNTRTTIIAACRPTKNKFDFGMDLAENAAMPGPLLSRFDLIFLLVDQPDSGADTLKSRFVLKRSRSEAKFSSGQMQYLLNRATGIKPRFGESGTEVLKKYFEIMRKGSQGDVTLRQLESLLRLTQAHARLCQREEVSMFDCISVILLYEASYRGVGLCGRINFEQEEEFMKSYNELFSRLNSDDFLIDDSIFNS